MRGNYYTKQTKGRADRLRSRGKNYREIKELLGIPKSTLSTWFSKKHANIFDKKAQLIHLAKIRPIAQQSIRKRIERRDNVTRLGATQLLKKLESSELISKLALGLLYWAEGTKSPQTNGVIFTNTDPLMIKLFATLLRDSYQVDENRFRIRIHVHYYHEKKTLVKFWSDLLDIPKEKFAPLLVKPRSKKRRFRKNPKGICFLCYHNSNIRREILAIARAFAEKVIGLKYSMNSKDVEAFAKNIAR